MTKHSPLITALAHKTPTSDKKTTKQQKRVPVSTTDTPTSEDKQAKDKIAKEKIGKKIIVAEKTLAKINISKK